MFLLNTSVIHRRLFLTCLRHDGRSEYPSIYVQCELKCSVPPTLLLPVLSYLQSHYEKCVCAHKCSAPPTLLFSMLNYNSTMKNVYVYTYVLLLPLYCFRCSITCNSTMKNVHVNSNALLLPLYSYRCSITLFLHPLICVADVCCARRGLPLKKLFAWMKDFA